GTVIDENVKDEIGITVIATGFSDRAKPSDEVLETSYKPTPFVRRDRVTEPNRVATPRPAVEPPPVEEPPLRPAPKVPSEDEELEIPAFIRKRIKK
ncbi:MAG: hypothetical protein PHI63_06800, partial [Patescibacteria group bacterium]|nr:hypothetical protein [Patescibacteria group bacterium]